MNKRDVMLSLLQSDQPRPYVPAAFFLHFPPDCHEGQAAVDKHLEFFRYTGMDLVKIQFEKPFPRVPQIQTPDDWARLPRYDREYFAGQLGVVGGLVKAAKNEAVVVVTLYSPFMGAAHAAGDAVIAEHLRQDPDKVRVGMEIATESMLVFVRECVRLGVDGFYASTQGGEAGRFHDLAIFQQYVMPYDLAVMNEIDAACVFNILHVCDYDGDYADFAPFKDYPGDVVSFPGMLAGQPITPRDAAALFGRPVMGGLARKGVLATGSPDEVRAAAEAVLRDAPERFVLAADCTVPSDTPWENLKTAVETAHRYERN
jgi:uroporphyrinogen decarboxylase